MKKLILALSLAVIVAASFIAGSWYAHRAGSSSQGQEGRKVLYYVDPMNPSHTSNKPGFAPCGMKMEPVYADEPSGSAQGSSRLSDFPAGTVRISSGKQQLIGVRTGVVEKKELHHVIRLLGRVTPDETRVFTINAAVDGLIIKTFPKRTWSFVKKNEILATYYSPEFLSANQALLFAVGGMSQFNPTCEETPQQKDQISPANLKKFRDTLKNLGMGDIQIDEMIRTRRYSEDVNITSPADGFILARNISNGQRFDKGAELYRIADLSEVWIIADLFENEAQFIKPGLEVTASLPYQSKVFKATVSNDLPQIDPGSRTLKTRIEVDNPDFFLRPEMFVDVEFPVNLPPTIMVPADALLYSGLMQTVFIDRGSGYFEPRHVETGMRLGDQVEITSGLAPGERIVVSGNFLIGSESRMKMAGAGLYGTVSKDPLCGMDVDENKASAAGRVSEYRGKKYYFCSDGCKQKFDAEPQRFLQKPPERRAQSAPSGTEAPPGIEDTEDLVCGMSVDPGKAEAAGLKTLYQGKAYYFCNEGCMKEFKKNPGRYLEKVNPEGNLTGQPLQSVAKPETGGRHD